MKKSTILITLLRATFLVLAYREVAHPKGVIIPPGTGRTTTYYAKSCYHICRSYLKTLRQRMLKH